MRSRLSSVLFSILLCPVVLAQPARAQQVNWQPFARGLEVAESTMPVDSLLSAQVTLVRAELGTYRPKVIRAEEFGRSNASVRYLCQQLKGAACINANFFDEFGKPLGLVMSRGMIFRPLHQGGKTLTGILALNQGKLVIVNRSDFQTRGAIEAVQAGPRLLAHGLALPGLNNSDSRSSRSGACLDSNGRLILFSTGASLRGITLTDLQNLLLSPAIACRDAINFDGGGSAQIYVSNLAPGRDPTSQDIFLPGRDNIPVALALLAYR